ncbi:hypothetical protein [Sicyoidochytrium minutum DNA virus]|nr:hypothetical protein [Sicyoidochytrium minutum DNA virus]
MENNNKMSAEIQPQDDPCPSVILKKYDSVLILDLPIWARNFLPQIMTLREQIKDWPYRLARFDVSHRLYEKVCVNIELWEPSKPDPETERSVNAWRKHRYESVRCGLVEPVTLFERQLRYIWSRRDEVIAKHGEQVWVLCVGDRKADEKFWKLAVFDSPEDAGYYAESSPICDAQFNVITTISDAFAEAYWDDSLALLE